MFCHICLSEAVRGEICNLKLCNEGFDKIREFWDKEDVKRY